VDRKMPIALLNIRNSTKLRCFHVFNHAMRFYGFFIGEWWMWPISFLIWNFIGTFGISIGFHRLLSHRSFKAKKWFKYFSSLIGCLATGGAPLSWVGAHRLHHSSPDGNDDPHSPIVKGYFNVYFHAWGKTIIPRKYIRDLIKSNYHKFLYRYYFLMLFFWAMALYAIDIRLGVFGYSVPAVMAFHVFGLINTCCHRYGYRTHNVSDSSTNNFWVNLVSCGEGWHNNHHKFPASHRIGLERGEFDISAFVIEKLGRAEKGSKENWSN
jgi:stearoyl-CoA desaturase (delta-9 desaturase)